MTDPISAQILSTTDTQLWQSFFPAKFSVFGGVEFASIVEQYVDYKKSLFVFTQGNIVIVYPLFLRSISPLPFAAKTGLSGWDTMSPEYTGPLAWGDVTPEIAEAFRCCFTEYCQQEGIVAEFAHLHPWHCSTTLLATEDIALNREIIYVDLTLPEEQLWEHSFNYTCRKNIKRSQRENIRVVPATTAGDIKEFYRIYTETMDRNQALTKYYFPLDYFLAFFETMPDHARFVLAISNDQVVAGTLYLHDETDVYSYLGGADHAFQHMRPTNAVIYETIRWAQSQGKKRLILGGGYQPDDGIFRFKASFSPLRANFYIYKHIHLANEYDKLCQAWSDHYQTNLNQKDYFPAYRSIHKE